MYSTYRADIAASFPGYLNSAGAGGYFIIDTTAFNNGIHTISWSVRDNEGITEGIGSRYFKISNGADETQASSMTSPLFSENPNTVYFNPSLSLTELLNLQVSLKPLVIRHGYDDGAGFEMLPPDSSGTARTTMEQAERLEIDLNSSLGNIAEDPDDRRNVSIDTGNIKTLQKSGMWEGYLVVGEKLRPLPIGSRLDRETGLFTWQPGPAFLGEYQFIFVRDHASLPLRVEILIEISPIKWTSYKA